MNKLAAVTLRCQGSSVRSSASYGRRVYGESQAKQKDYNPRAVGWFNNAPITNHQIHAQIISDNFSHILSPSSPVPSVQILIPNTNEDFPPSPFWAGWNMDEIRNRKTPCQTTQPTKPCPVHEYYLWRGVMHLFKLSCLAWWQCKYLLKFIACCWPAVSRRSGRTERHWPLILCELLQVTQYCMDTFALISSLIPAAAFARISCELERVLLLPTSCQRVSPWNTCVFFSYEMKQGRTVRTQKHRKWLLIVILISQLWPGSKLLSISCTALRTK